MRAEGTFRQRLNWIISVRGARTGPYPRLENRIVHVTHSDHLDTLLYAWLSEADSRRAEQRFSTYFRTAFPDVCRFIRSLRVDPQTAQDIAQQALIKLLNRLGTERRAADERFRCARIELRPLDFGALHSRLVEAWRRQLGNFRDAAIGFRIPREPQRAPVPWQELREEINGRIEPLGRQGMHLLGEVRTRVEATLTGLVGSESPQGPGSRGRAGHRPTGSPESQQKVAQDCASEQIQAFVAALLQYAQGRDWARVASELACSGSVEFVSRTSIVCENLPPLAIPSNGLLYTIAKRLFLDGLRTKRPESSERIDDVADNDGESVLDELDFDGAAPTEAPTAVVESWSNLAEPDTHAPGAPESEVEARYRGFLELLREPLTRAEAALAAAASKGRAKAEIARVESLRAKYQRLLAVLNALRETPQPTEEEIARRQGLTRNQVKYVIERIRKEFSYYFPDLAREAQGRRKRQEGDS